MKLCAFDMPLVGNYNYYGLWHGSCSSIRIDFALGDRYLTDRDPISSVNTQAKAGFESKLTQAK